jgi:hypothetical protein
MRRKTTAKPRSRVDDVVWRLFVQACEGLCCVCLKEKRPLHRGHIQRHEDGGTTAFENLIPVCKSCNSKYKGGFTPDRRPEGWRDTFVKLLLAEMGLGIMCAHIKPCVHTSADGQAIENTALVDLQTVKFVQQIHYSTHDAHTSSKQRMTAADATKLIRRLVNKGKQCAIPPKRPFAKRQDTMKLLAIQRDEVAFMQAGEEFLLEQPWINGSEERGGASAASDSWLHFCDSFDDYLADARARAARRAQQAKVDHERKLADEERGVLYKRRQRWNDYIRTADVPHWPAMLDGDAHIIADVAARKASQPQDITSEQYELSLAVFRRWKIFKSDEILGEKQRLRVKLAQCAAWAARYNADIRKDYAATIKAHTDWLDRAKTIEVIEHDAWTVDALHADLDPDRPVAGEGEDF